MRPCATPVVLELLSGARGGNDYRVLAEDLGWFPHLASTRVSSWPPSALSDRWRHGVCTETSSERIS